MLLFLLLLLAPDFQMTLERGMCFGTCPVYRVTISANGDVTFEGERFTKVIGVRHKRISRDAVKQLNDAVNDINFFDLGRYDEEGTCPQYTTDGPHLAITVTMNGRTKKVPHYTGCNGFPIEKKLIAFENRIDEIAGIEEWKKR